MAKFTVDTHLFRELGELLVSRESTALVELIKNAYDADATLVTVYGENLEDPNKARIILSDDGNGMTRDVFESGFLRIASRSKDGSTRRSPRYRRRFTGAKGVGRLAAHKLAWVIQVQSIPNISVHGQKSGIDATIDWKLIESVESLDEVESTGGVVVKSVPRTKSTKGGTRVVLSHLKKKWSAKQRLDFFGEIDSFLPPVILSSDVSSEAVGRPLFSAPRVRDEQAGSPGFQVVRTGELDVGDDEQSNVLSAADWIVEIDAQPSAETAMVRLLPTRKFIAEFPKAKARTFKLPLPKVASVGFQARILFQHSKSWNRSGIRIYQEGFRVLPYGEQRNDWLELDEDYKRRGRNLRFLDKVPDLGRDEDLDPNIGLSFSGNSSYFGAVFLTADQSKALRMLVNREGFEWSEAFEEVKRIVRTSLDLLVRERAAYTLEKRIRRSESRIKDSAVNGRAGTVQTVSSGSLISDAVKAAEAQLSVASDLISSGDQPGAIAALEAGVLAVHQARRASDALLTDASATRLLAALGLQLTAYIHEIHNLLVMIREITGDTNELRKLVSGEAKSIAARLDRRAADLQRAIERQANYLADVTAADARRRRSKQPVRERFEQAQRLYEHELEVADITVKNTVDPTTKTTVAMFSAELTLIFSNLLSNAIKAAGAKGGIKLRSYARGGRLCVSLENTGKAIDLEDAEQWFLPFQSTSEISTIYLGQGMGMGLTITRELLDDYGATIRFVKPSVGYATSIEIQFP